VFIGDPEESKHLAFDSSTYKRIEISCVKDFAVAIQHPLPNGGGKKFEEFPFHNGAILSL
jgi:hypothetical protein